MDEDTSRIDIEDYIQNDFCCFIEGQKDGIPERVPVLGTTQITIMGPLDSN